MKHQLAALWSAAVAMLCLAAASVSLGAAWPWMSALNLVLALLNGALAVSSARKALQS